MQFFETAEPDGFPAKLALSAETSWDLGLLVRVNALLPNDSTLSNGDQHLTITVPDVVLQPSDVAAVAPAVNLGPAPQKKWLVQGESAADTSS